MRHAKITPSPRDRYNSTGSTNTSQQSVSVLEELLGGFVGRSRLACRVTCQPRFINPCSCHRPAVPRFIGWHGFTFLSVFLSCTMRRTCFPTPQRSRRNPGLLKWYSWLSQEGWPRPRLRPTRLLTALVATCVTVIVLLTVHPALWPGEHTGALPRVRAVNPGGCLVPAELRLPAG